MSEDLVAAAQREKLRSFGEYEQVGLGTLAAYEAWQAEGLSPREIAARMTRASRLGAETVGWYQLLTRVGVPVTEAGEVAAETAAARSMRVQLGAPEQAEVVCDRFDNLVEQVAAGRESGAAIADFRESLVGWRGEGCASGLFNEAALVTFDDGTVLPDGVELAGVRETGARHSIVAPQVEAGIDAYLAACAEGLDEPVAFDTVGGSTDVRYAVGKFAYDLKWHAADPQDAKAHAVADTVAQAAVGQFLSLRNAGVEVDTAVATAAGGDPVALHAIGGFVERTRDGIPEDFAESGAEEAAVLAVKRGESYRGLTGVTDGLLTTPEIYDDAAAAIEARVTGEFGVYPVRRDGVAEEAVRGFDWLTRHGMDSSTAARLAAADAASRHVHNARSREDQVLYAAQDVVDDAAEHLDDPAEDTPAAHVDDDGQLRLGDQVTECGQAVDAAEDAVRRGENVEDDTARSGRIARWQADDQAAAERADESGDGWEQQ